RKLPGIPPGTFAITDARDVADAMIAAGTHGRRGERYIAAGAQVTMRELGALLATLSGVKAPMSISMPMLFIVATLSELGGAVSGKPALVNRPTARLVALNRDRNGFDVSKTTRELGVTFRPAEQTLRDVLTWFEQQGSLPAPRAGARVIAPPRSASPRST